jgi:acylpyruvate hydrolase
MRLVRFRRYRHIGLGALVEGNRIVDLQAAATALLAEGGPNADPFAQKEVELRLAPDTCEFLAGGSLSRELAQHSLRWAMRPNNKGGIGGEPLLLARSEVELLPPVVPPLLLGKGAHFRDSPGGPDLPQHGEFFLRNPHSILSVEQTITLPRWLPGPAIAAPKLAIVIGSSLRNADRAEAEAAIFGYCGALDIRLDGSNKLSWAGALWHLQYPHSRSFDGSIMLGPAIVTKDEVDDLASLRASLTIGGNQTFDGLVPGAADDLVEWICRLSEAVTLRPGTVLVPASADDAVVVPSTDPQAPLRLLEVVGQPLQDGDEVAVSITGLGQWRARIRMIDKASVGTS